MRPVRLTTKERDAEATAVTRPSHREPRLLYPEPKRSFMDNASVIWMILVAAATPSTSKTKVATLW
jgi:hypothetical protein